MAHFSDQEIDLLSNRLARVFSTMGVNGSFEVGMVFRTSMMAAVVERALMKLGVRIVDVPSANTAPERRNHPAYATTARAVITTTDGLDVVPSYVPAIVLDAADIQRLVASVSDGPLRVA